jgi:hypothetical protein
VSDIDTAVVVDSLKVLDPEWPIREADIAKVMSTRPNRVPKFRCYTLKNPSLMALLAACADVTQSNLNRTDFK